MTKTILLLLDPSFSGYGDITNLLRIGKFLKSKGYTVYSTIIFSNKITQVTVDVNTVIGEIEIPTIIHPSRVDSLIKLLERGFEKRPGHYGYAVTQWNTSREKFWERFKEWDCGADGISLKMYNLIKEYQLITEKTEQNFDSLLSKLLDEAKKTIRPKIDYELVIYLDTISYKYENIKRILIDQYSGPEQYRHIRKADFVICPIPKKDIPNAIKAGFYTHSNYAHISKTDLVESLIKNRGMVFMQKHLLESKWGIYYSGTLGTNGLFIRLLTQSLPLMKKIHQKITYFSFLDEKHFAKYVIPYLGKEVGVIDLTRDNPIINDPYKKNVLFVNLIVRTEFMESIVNCSDLCSVCAGDGSFNILYARLRENKKFCFFKYYNRDQEYFFRFIVNKLHEFETRNGLNHDISKIFFAFGYYENIFQYHLKKDDKNTKIKVDQFTMFEREYKKFNLLHYFTDEKKDFELMQKLFYDPKIIAKFNSIMSCLIDFLKTEDQLLPVEDVLLEILEKK